MKRLNILIFVMTTLTTNTIAANNLPPMNVDCPNDFLDAFPVGIAASAVKKHYGNPTEITPDGHWIYADFFNDGDDIDTNGRIYIFKINYGQATSASVSNVDLDTCASTASTALLLTVTMPGLIRRPYVLPNYAAATRTDTIVYALAFFAVAGLITTVVLMETKKETE